jgi:chromosome segregation protein
MLKSLEIAGFKSFAKKSKLDFTSSVTAIVGPNGSGKSNVVEAIRFVLGEQSMKSLRGKSGSDLIFKGSKVLAKLSRASVSIVFDNRKRIFSEGQLSDSIKLDFDEIVISREVYADGGNKYLVNGSEVRLKDVLEILSRVHIGSSGHHIISQGEADRILSASSKDRRQMVEDALGLKVYQYRLKESERKLERTRANIKEVGLLRREIAPHIVYLKKQVEKIEKAESMRNELETLYGEYLKREEESIQKIKHSLVEEEKILHAKLEEFDTALSDVSVVESASSAQETNQERNEKSRELDGIRRLIDELTRKLGRLEGMIEMKELEVSSPKVVEHKESFVVGRNDVVRLIDDIEHSLSDSSLHSTDALLSTLRSLKDSLKRIISEEVIVGESLSENSQKDILGELRTSHEEISKEIHTLSQKEQSLSSDIAQIDVLTREQSEKNREKDRARYEIMMKKNELVSEKTLLSVRREQLESREQRFVEEVREASVLIGQSVLSYKNLEINTDDTDTLQEERRRKIERIKIKLEDVGAGGGGDVITEYKDVTERDSFLSKEVEDLTSSMESLESLIRELKEKLDHEFKEGIDKINKEFQTFFSVMFGGGTAFLSLVAESKKKKKGEDEEEMSDVEAEEEVFEHGIDINVSLPQKKVKELSMLSGGERSLTSIALLFAITQVNPPPFLVLDETDAALDEANSRRYGDMIERLSEFSQLLVVTHNRETMSRADVLYGVTVGADGGSKLLSIQFDEAVKVAK